jgi:hypothetical protein
MLLLLQIASERYSTAGVMNWLRQQPLTPATCSLADSMTAKTRELWEINAMQYVLYAAQPGEGRPCLWLK